MICVHVNTATVLHLDLRSLLRSHLETYFQGLTGTAPLANQRGIHVIFSFRFKPSLDKATHRIMMNIVVI